MLKKYNSMCEGSKDVMINSRLLKIIQIDPVVLIGYKNDKVYMGVFPCTALFTMVSD